MAAYYFSLIRDTIHKERNFSRAAMANVSSKVINEEVYENLLDRANMKMDEEFEMTEKEFRKFLDEL